MNTTFRPDQRVLWKSSKGYTPPAGELATIYEVSDTGAGINLPPDDQSPEGRSYWVPFEELTLAPVRVITITEDAPNHFTVREGDRFVDRLMPDEAMVMAIKLLNSSFPGFPMLTAEQHAALAGERKARLARINAEPIDPAGLHTPSDQETRQ